MLTVQRVEVLRAASESHYNYIASLFLRHHAVHVVGRESISRAEQLA